MTKKIIVILMVLMMLISFSGCSYEEQRLYSLMKEVSTLDTFETSSYISVYAEGPALSTVTSNMPEQYVFLKDILTNGLEIRTTSKQSGNPLQYEITVDFRYKGESEFRKFTTIVGNKDLMYIKVDDLLTVFKPFILAASPDSEKMLDVLVSGLEYIEIDLNDQRFKGISGNSVFSNSEQNKELLKIFMGFSDAFKDSLNGFSSGKVARKNQGYILQCDTKGFQEICISFVEYLVKNIDHVVQKLEGEISTLTEEEIALLKTSLNNPALSKDFLLTGLEELRNAVKEITLEEMEELKDPNGEFANGLKVFDGSSLSYSIEKAKNGKFIESMQLKIQHLSGITIHINETSNITGLNTFTASLPAKATRLKDLMDLAEKFGPSPKVRSIRMNTRTGKAAVGYSNGKVSEVKMFFYTDDGNTYVPLRTVAELFGEETGWDDQRKQAYIKRKYASVDMPGVNKYGMTYVKVREFEKLGYKIQWLAATNEVLITK